MLTIRTLYDFERRVMGMKPSPSAHGEGVHVTRSFKKTHEDLIAARWPHVLTAEIEQQLRENGFEQELERG